MSTGEYSILRDCFFLYHVLWPPFLRVTEEMYVPKEKINVIVHRSFRVSGIVEL